MACKNDVNVLSVWLWEADAQMALPAAIATYSLPSTANAMGGLPSLPVTTLRREYPLNRGTSLIAQDSFDIKPTQPSGTISITAGPTTASTVLPRPSGFFHIQGLT